MFLATVLHEHQGIPVNETLHQEALKKRTDMLKIIEIVEDLRFRLEEVKAVRNNWMYSADLKKVVYAKILLEDGEIERGTFLHLAFGYGCKHKKQKTK